MTRATLLPWAFPDQGRRAVAIEAAHMLREHTVRALDAALADSPPRSALLVKGAGLARTVYPEPARREMVDVDALVAPGALPRVRAALARAGWEELGPGDRPWTEASLEVALAPPGKRGVLVELHASLDKVVPRVAAVREVFARAAPLDGLPALGVPSIEDHALLVVQHVAADGFHHRAGFADLEALFGAGADVDVFVARAKSWGASTAAYVALETLDHLAPGVVPASARLALAPRGPRARAVARAFDVGAWPVARGGHELGGRWLAKQTVLRDDTAAWLAGLGLYGARRVAERLWMRSRG